MNRNTIRTTFTLDAAKIYEHRMRRGMTQRALARAAAISPQMMNDIEAGRRAGSPAVRIRIAEALGVELADICRGAA